MAVILKGEGDSSPYSYEQLAQLWNAHLQGNPAASIALSKMPATERRTAEMVYKAYSPGTPKKVSKKGKKRSKAITKALKPPSAKEMRRNRLQMLLTHPDAWVRETARKELGQ